MVVGNADPLPRRDYQPDKTRFSLSPQVSATAAAVSAGDGGRQSPQVVQGGWHPDIIVLNGTTTIKKQMCVRSVLLCVS